MSQYIFVYGTLKRGGANHSLLGGCEFVGVGQIRGCVLLNLGPFPGMVIANTENKNSPGVIGEVYSAPDEVWPWLLAQLDLIEGIPKLFQRVKIDVNVDRATKECTAYIYTITMGDELIIQGGEWRVPIV